MSRAYYNENDEFAAAWLRNLIKAGLIADGEVDTRSIVDVRPGDLAGFTQCHFFAGIGGWSYALRKAGWNDSRPAWTGSCPCQPFSLAGAQRGFADERHLWPVWRELIRECSPAVVFGEQVASATEWLRLVRGDLEAMGYAVGALPIQAASAGADHLRDRYWFVANASEQRGETGLSGSIEGHEGDAGILDDRCCEIRMADSDQPCQSEGWQQRSGQLGGAGGDPKSRDGGAVANATGAGPLPSSHAGVCGEQEGARAWDGEPERRSGPLEWVIGADGKARRVKPGIRLLVDGVPNRVGKLRGFGNAIDPRPAAAFIEAYMTSPHTQQDRGTP